MMNMFQDALGIDIEWFLEGNRDISEGKGVCDGFEGCGGFGWRFDFGQVWIFKIVSGAF